MFVEDQIFKMCLRELNKQGSVLLLPTETVYGLMCNWSDSVAQRRIRKMKSRGEEKPFQMLAPDVESVIDYGVEITPYIKKVVDKFCPGPVTIIANMKRVDKTGIKTVGFRIPAYPFLLDLMKESGKLFAATSANITGEPTTTTVADALESLKEQPDIAVDAGKIKGEASTVIDMTQEKFKILREGAVKKEKVFAVLLARSFHEKN